MNELENHLREQIVELSASLYARGLASRKSGNISVRLDDGWLLTPANTCLGKLDPARIAKLDWEGKHLAGDSPSEEAYLHRAFYEKRPEAGAIAHLHSSHVVAVSCMTKLNSKDCIPPLTPYYVMKIGRLPLIPYYRPGDVQLSVEIGWHARWHSAVLLANHGSVVTGANLEAAVDAAEELEETAKLFLLLQSTSKRQLSANQIEELEKMLKQ